MDCEMPSILTAGLFKIIMNNRSTPLLKVENLRTHFRIPEGTVYAVNGISFSAYEGETIAVVGESGCGKSVTMLSILGLIPIPPGEIVSGEAIYRDKNLLKISDSEFEHLRGEQIAMVFQDPMTSLNPVLTIGRQITETLRAHLGMSQLEAEKKAIDLLAQVGIPEASSRLGNYPHQFSGGMRQRVMIAIALACNPCLLIADEPTTALDVTIQAQIVELVLKLREQYHMTIIWITHDLGVVAGLADRVIVMYAGFIVEEAPVDDLYDDPRHPYTLALLGALPRVDRRRDRHLNSIPGAPPNLLVEPKGCPFAPRCTYVTDRCWIENPGLVPVTTDHKLACWVDIKSTVTGS
jgi:oligopeptide transport system ATP-binding protein